MKDDLKEIIGAAFVALMAFGAVALVWLLYRDGEQQREIEGDRHHTQRRLHELAEAEHDHENRLGRLETKGAN